MADDRTGTVRNFGGKVQEGVGTGAGNATTESEGMMS